MLEFAYWPTKPPSSLTESTLPELRCTHVDTVATNQGTHDDNDEADISIDTSIDLLNEMKINKLYLVRQWINECGDLTERK